MELQRLSVKLLAEETNIKTQEFVHVFHSWIRNKKLKDHLMIDVADYKHVSDNPGPYWLLMKEIFQQLLLKANWPSFINANVFWRVLSQNA